MKTISKLQTRRIRLKQQIHQRLDLLIGTVVRSPSMGGWCLTDKVAGKTVTRYVRKRIVADAQRMSRNCQCLWKLLRQLSGVNWRLLQHKSRGHEPPGGATHSVHSHRRQSPPAA